MKEIIKEVMAGGRLSRDKAQEAMGLLMDGQATPVQTAAFLVALRVRGETFEEIVGFARAMRVRATKVTVKRKPLLDTCGTGGDGSGTFNISTCAALIAAGAGAAVAKHGNRSVSSRCGSADVLEALGVKTEIPPERAALCVEEAGVGFLFAPALHPAVRYVMPVRRELGARTVFNLLGPLANPAGAKRQLLGVFSTALVPVIARALGELGSEEALVVSSRDGMDEISLSAKTVAARLKNGRVTALELDTKDLGFRKASPKDLAGGGAKDNAEIILSVLKGKKGAPRDISLVNAGAALWVGGRAASLKAGILLAAQAVDSGRALAGLEKLKALSNA